MALHQNRGKPDTSAGFFLYGVTQQTKKRTCIFASPYFLLVPGARLELARGCPRRILSPLRLPIPPSRQTDQDTWAMPHMHGVSGFVAQGAPIRQVLRAVGSLIGPKAARHLGTALAG